MNNLSCLLKIILIGLIISCSLKNITQVNAAPIQSVSDIDNFNQSNSDNYALNQINSVSRLSDISVDSWKFQTLQALVEKYNCMNRLSEDMAFSDQRLNRYQFAAGLNTCIVSINKLIINEKSNLIDRESLTEIQRLKTEFSAELKIFDNRVNLLETNINTLKTPQFLPHIELEGEIIFAVTGLAGRQKAKTTNKPINDNLIFSNRVRLSLESSFTGKDKLQVRLQGRNTPELEDATGTKMANLGFDGDDDNEVELDEIKYRLALGKETRITLYGLGGGLGDLVPSINPLFSGSGDGSISTFGRENPIRRQGGGVGVGISHNLNDAANFSLGYIASNAANSERGIFASPNGAIAQLTLEPTKTTALSFTYVYSRNNLNTGTGSELTSDPFDDQANTITANSFGAEAAWQLNPTIALGGRVGFIHAKAEDLPTDANAMISTWAMLLSLRDIGKKGSFAGFVVGQPPKVTYNSFGGIFKDKDTSLHLEAFYHFQITDNLAITPGLFVITSPEHDDSNDSIYVGTVRTTFNF
ncbi:Carbohydrate-selective porin, OprB family [Cylindrospermum stagnale PCC 7417]|uniref:Carbohydrate-selective porin, OprB family n=1 Tax=Cylindrospermum stagnale PCC 7417 TaxID=56107 RepID=K9WYG5_9NOST|nr:iron uptake porin [Cylindrospermum stagnale]AFZ25410.1 Carbohydrate-selective porin, OprB family [Cylindrospermum stagnale PCC 7417]